VNGLHEPGADDELREVSADEAELPSVDSLESQLSGVESAMNLLQDGDVEAAEEAIVALEQPIEDTTSESE